MKRLIMFSAVLLTMLAACDRKAEQTAAMGVPVSDGQFTFTVSGFECGQHRVGNDFINDQPIGAFCFVDVAVTNNGTESRDFHAGFQRLIDTTGGVHKADFGASWIESEQWPAFTINPGLSASTTLVFDVANPSTMTKIELHDSPFSTGATVQLSGQTPIADGA